ncbi:hypothetical protein ACDP63_14375 [Paracoccus sp. P2]|uniref:Glycosyltransferase family 1 protein n=1 Tax=Paracoccus pantotrophus TaxID=82367 RepID=A0A7H9C111_PARPN|nr:hypothetical protein [Paracoccus pantotrophus]MDF3854695.1 hypothetical protein [Paracoccus pantotrophus]QLH15741.1 hypothetical protein HYQ43_16455 [Paracoccus pantotrophus]RDD95936.1 hypothetical protein DTW92_15130 [Paracoccus pantotrophus]RNI19759.1 hypothetical protein EB844_02815 [Paracoccus pantotrophus]WGR63942.1 hypothetical protein E3U24_00845 [Paracoccus pantotrophus]
MADPVREQKLGSLTVFSNHPVLDQFARDMLAGIRAENLPAARINLYVGIHRKFGPALFRRGLRLGLQTEHYFDENGRTMWRKPRPRRLLKQLLFYHLILDLSPANAPYYRWLPRFLRRRVLFGPHVFPCRPVPYRAGQRPPVFFGAINDRRAKILAGLPKDHCDLLSETYGTDLHKAICDSRGVVNIHFADGIYTEYPRLLSSYLAGKPVLSEKLGAELVEGRDYGTLGQDHTDHQLRTIFSSFCSGFAARHRLTDFLRRIAGP